MTARLFGEAVPDFRLLINGCLTSQVIYAAPMDERTSFHWLVIARLPALVNNDRIHHLCALQTYFNPLAAAFLDRLWFAAPAWPGKRLYRHPPVHLDANPNPKRNDGPDDEYFDVFQHRPGACFSGAFWSHY